MSQREPVSPTYTECGPSEGGGNFAWIVLEPEACINNGCGADCKGCKSPVTPKTGTSEPASAIRIHDPELRREAREPIAGSLSIDGSYQASQLHRDLDARNQIQQVRCVRDEVTIVGRVSQPGSSRRWLLTFLVVLYDLHESIVAHDGTRRRS